VNSIVRRAAIGAACAATLVCGLAVAPAAMAQVSLNITIGTPPPAPVYEAVPAPRAGFIWVPGFWDWDGARHAHVWAPGRWEAERPGYAYEAPRWERRPEGWVLMRGGWGGRPEPYRGPEHGRYDDHDHDHDHHHERDDYDHGPHDHGRRDHD